MARDPKRPHTTPCRTTHRAAAATQADPPSLSPAAQAAAPPAADQSPRGTLVQEVVGLRRKSVTAESKLGKGLKDTSSVPLFSLPIPRHLLVTLQSFTGTSDKEVFLFFEKVLHGF